MSTSPESNHSQSPASAEGSETSALTGAAVHDPATPRVDSAVKSAARTHAVVSAMQQADEDAESKAYEYALEQDAKRELANSAEHLEKVAKSADEVFDAYEKSGREMQDTLDAELEAYRKLVGNYEKDPLGVMERLKLDPQVAANWMRMSPAQRDAHVRRLENEQMRIERETEQAEHDFVMKAYDRPGGKDLVAHFGGAARFAKYADRMTAEAMRQIKEQTGKPADISFDDILQAMEFEKDQKDIQKQTVRGRILEAQAARAKLAERQAKSQTKTVQEYNAPDTGRTKRAAAKKVFGGSTSAREARLAKTFGGRDWRTK